MSRVLLFGLDNFRRGEVNGLCDRTWSVEGSRSTTGGGSTRINLGATMASNPDMQLGRMVLIDHAKLGQWAGVVDTPWGALPPVSVTLYSASYLFKIRSPETPVRLTGTTFQIVSRMVELINDQEETYLRMGDESTEHVYREETFDQRNFWDQLTALLKRAGREMLVRPELREGRLYLVIDVKKRIGEDTDFLLHDGERANLQIRDARVDGEIWNRITGIGTQRSDRITSQPQFDQESITRYRMRTRIERSQATNDNLLEENARTALEHDEQPWLTLKADALDVGETLDSLRPGNGYMVHASRVILPGGVRGWRGRMRVMDMALNEGQNTVGLTLEAQL